MEIVQDMDIAAKSVEIKLHVTNALVTTHPLSENLNCPNWEYNNNKYNTKYNTNHSAIDSEHCEILKNKIKT